jgi:hypothetical protein
MIKMYQTLDEWQILKIIKRTPPDILNGIEMRILVTGLEK